MASKQDMSKVDEIDGVYCSINGEAFIKINGEVRVGVPVQDDASVLSNFTSEGLIVDLCRGDDVEEITTSFYDDMFLNDALASKGHDFLNGASMPEIDAPEHPPLTLPEGSSVTVNGEAVEAQTISVIYVYLDKEELGEVARLRMDIGAEGYLYMAYSDDRLIGASFTPMSDVLAEFDLDESPDSQSVHSPD